MGTDSGIEWTHDTANPWWGCTKKKTRDGRVRRACAHCYAEAFDARLRREGETHWGDDAPRLLQLETFERQLRASARKGEAEGRPRRVFIASMADLFEDRADLLEPRAKVFELLHELAGQIVPLLLTKRPDVALRESVRLGWPPGAWLGVSVENQDAAEEMIPTALQVEGTAGVFLSMEPLVSGGVNLERVRLGVQGTDVHELDALHGSHGYRGRSGSKPTASVGWVIAGGESGQHARPTHPDVIRDLREQCARAGVPFFFKQWGEWSPYYAGDPPGLTGRVFDPTGPGLGHLKFWKLGKKAAGATLDGELHRELPAGWAP